ncbi:Zinc finger protein 594 [Thelohanellus kitauei]|uniref:Zinc finger protein 594 n=1 Tax=Thelohanellus kitauei TaxID=669202 RepID=A0A0C2MPD9_THEKT|nr:Zinc finger protein 594 [Thelohanellus kitauei]
MSMEQLPSYNYANFTKIEGSSDQNELNECIENLVKGDHEVDFADHTNSVFDSTQDNSAPKEQPMYCPVCHKYLKSLDELQHHTCQVNPSQSSHLFNDSSVLTVLPTCPSCKLEMRKLTSYPEYPTGEDNGIAQSGIFVICEYCEKAYKVDMPAPQPPPPAEAPKRHFCEHCDKSYKHNRDLRKHQRTHHGMTDVNPQNTYQNFNNNQGTSGQDPPPPANKMTCDICSKNFRGPFELRRHVLTVHENKRPYKCTHCTKYFRDAYELKRHSVSHQRVHLQNMATPRLPNEAVCADMMRQHTAEGQVDSTGRPGMINNAGVSRDVYSNQQGQVYPNQNSNVDYYCSACEKNFRGSNEFKRHYTVVHEKKYRYKCIHCGKLWRDQYDLKRHCRRSHFIDQEIDRAFIRKCLLEASNPQEPNPAVQSLNINPPSYDMAQHVSLTLNREAAAAIYGPGDQSVQNNMDHTYQIVDHDHISMVRTSPTSSLFHNLPSMQSASMLYHSSTDPTSHLIENMIHQQDSEDINEETKNAVNWSNFESDIQVKKMDYS